MTAITDEAFIIAYIHWVQHRSFSFSSPADKARFHFESERVLRIIARKLNLKAGNFSIVSIKGGIASSGEIVLETSAFRMVISEIPLFDGVHLSFRRYGSCQTDPALKPSNSSSIHALRDLRTFMCRLNAATSHQQGRPIV